MDLAYNKRRLLNAADAMPDLQSILHPEIPRGRYQHYKGYDYQLIDIARHSETEEAHAVYRTLYGDFSLWIRPLGMFTETINHNGQNIPRFRFVGDLD